MSCFVVEDKTINRIVSFLANERDREWYQRQLALAINFGHTHPDFNQKLGEALLNLNLEAYRQRYTASEDDLPLYKFKWELVSLPQALKSLRCLIYQCSEGNVPDTPLYKELDALSHRWALKLCDMVPAYNTADWG
jgi:hypothetical protein